MGWPSLGIRILCNVRNPCIGCDRIASSPGTSVLESFSAKFCPRRNNDSLPSGYRDSALILLVYLGEVIHLAVLRARHKYELYEDGLYVDSGIVNLQNTYIAPVAFSDARLIMPLSLRVLGRGKIIVDANDERHFTLLLIKNPVE